MERFGVRPNARASFAWLLIEISRFVLASNRSHKFDFEFGVPNEMDPNRWTRRQGN
jgi:hypothetical protein